MAIDDFERFLKGPVFFYKSVGIIVNADALIGWRETLFIQALYYFGLLNMNANLLGEFVYAFVAFRAGNLVDAVMTLSYIGFVFMGTFKMLYVSRKQREVADYLNELCSIFPKSTADIEFYRMKRYSQKCTRITIAFSMLYMILIWTYNLFALFQYLVVEKWLHRIEIGEQLPYSVYIPWEWKGNWSFYLLYASQTIAGYTAAAAQIANDLLLCATATQVIMHYDYIARRIKAYQPTQAVESIKTKNSPNIPFLCNLVQFHVRILNLTDKMNSIFGVPLLLNFMTSCCVICFVGFQITVGFSTEMMIKLALFLVSSMAQIYLICYYGEELQNSSENIALAVYQHHWHDADLAYKRMMLIMVQRSQKAARLKATFLLNVSQCTMTDLLQISYKFFAVLRTMYSE